MPAIVARGLTRTFGDRVAVDQLSFELDRGQLCALLGPNGAGKTTTLRMLAGLLSPSGGSASVAGVAIPNEPAALARLRGKVGLLTEVPGFYDRLSAQENLELFGGLYGMSGQRLAEPIERHLRQLGLWDRRNDRVATFSKGMKQRLALVRTVFHDPEVLLFDEPTAGLDPEAAREVRGSIHALKRSGHTVIVSTHNLGEAAELADRIAVIRSRLLAFGPPDQLGHRTEFTRVRIVTAEGADRTLEAVSGLAEVRAARVVDRAAVIDVASDADVAAIVRRLVNAGLGVLEVKPLRPTLEEVYLQAVEGEL